MNPQDSQLSCLVSSPRSRAAHGGHRRAHLRLLPAPAVGGDAAGGAGGRHHPGGHPGAGHALPAPIPQHEDLRGHRRRRAPGTQVEPRMEWRQGTKNGGGGGGGGGRKSKMELWWRETSTCGGGKWTNWAVKFGDHSRVPVTVLWALMTACAGACTEILERKGGAQGEDVAQMSCDLIVEAVFLTPGRLQEEGNHLSSRLDVDP